MKLKGWDALSSAWDSEKSLRWIAPSLFVLWELMMLTRPSLLEHSVLGVWWAAALMAALCAAAFARHRAPVLSCVAAALLCVGAATQGWFSYVVFGAYLCLYGCMVRAPWSKAWLGGGLLIAGCAAASVIDACVVDPTAEIASVLGPSLIPLLMQLALVVAVALLSHTRFDQRVRETQVQAEQARAQQEAERLSQARDAAQQRSRIAAELHDSVGHDLTAIIALSEGLSGITGDSEVDKALISIGELARAGLEDTRYAVRALAGERDDALVTSDVPNGDLRYSWDDLAPVLATVRSTGVMVTHVETGRRAHDDYQADLVVKITREALTNALRHAHEAVRISVAWDHLADGSCDLRVSDDGKPAELLQTHTSTGTGLLRLTREVEAVGGKMSAGPAQAGGWRVSAHIPACKQVGLEEGKASVHD